jgi:hypothetical protein
VTTYQRLLLFLQIFRIYVRFMCLLLCHVG